MSLECGSWDDPSRTSLVTMSELMKPSWCPHPNAGLIWDMTADVALELDNDGSLHDLAVIHHLLALKIKKQDDRRRTGPFEGSFPSDWMNEGTCIASSCEGNVCENGHCLKTLSEQHRQLAKLYGRLSMSDKSEMELTADCHGVEEVYLMTALKFYSMVNLIESLKRLKRAHEWSQSLVGNCSLEQKIGVWQDALENEMNLKDSEAYRRPAGSKYLVGSSSAAYCNSKYSHTW